MVNCEGREFYDESTLHDILSTCNFPVNYEESLIIARISEDLYNVYSSSPTFILFPPYAGRSTYHQFSLQRALPYLVAWFNFHRDFMTIFIVSPRASSKYRPFR
jgi:hypothetical protein